MYTAEISRKNPTLLVLLLDQSGSTSNLSGVFEAGRMLTLAEAIASGVNLAVESLIDRCTGSEGIKAYADICIIGYGANVGPCWTGPLAGKKVVSLSEAAADGNYEVVRVGEEDRLIWVLPTAGGYTPMLDAVNLAAEIVEDWCMSHMESFPPTVVNVTDGQATNKNCQEEDPAILIKAADGLKAIGTADGPVLFYNFHLKSAGSGDLGQAGTVLFPSDEAECQGDRYATTLFKMSSVVPAAIKPAALGIAKKADDGKEIVGMGINARPSTIVSLFDLGTRAVVKDIGQV